MLNPSIVALSLCGFLVSLYAVHIERSRHLDATYQAHCDLDETIACSQVLTSEYGTGMGLVKLLLGEDHWLNLPNAYLGLGFFSLTLLIAVVQSKPLLRLVALACLLSCLYSVYFVYIMVAVLQKICLVCTTVHAINFMVSFLVVAKLFQTEHTRVLTSAAKSHSGHPSESHEGQASQERKKRH